MSTARAVIRNQVKNHLRMTALDHTSKSIQIGRKVTEGKEEWRVDLGGKETTTNDHNNENNEGLTYSSAGVLGLFDCSPDEESARLRHDPDPRQLPNQSSHIL